MANATSIRFLTTSTPQARALSFGKSAGGYKVPDRDDRQDQSFGRHGLARLRSSYSIDSHEDVARAAVDDLGLRCLFTYAILTRQDAARRQAAAWRKWREPET